MEKYILDLIKENNRVIIPNFGAFIISKENGISILFNNFLSFNDGLLVNYVAENKGIDTIVATDQVFDFVDTLKKELDEKGIYNIEKLGVFKKDENGILRFQQASDLGDFSDLEQDFKVTKEISLEKIEDITDNNEANLLDIDSSSEIIDTPDEEKIKEEEKIITDKIEESILTIDKEDAEGKSVVKEEGKKITPQIVSRNKEQVVKEKHTSSSSKKNVHKYSQKISKDKKRKDVITFVIIALLVVLCIAVYFVFFSKKKEVVKTTPIKVEKPINTEVKHIDTVKVVEEEIKSKPLREINKPAIVSNAFYVIVGSFKQHENALKMVEKLESKGFTNAQILTKGKMFLVSADSNVSYRVIEARQQEILEKNKMESWLYKIQ